MVKNLPAIAGGARDTGSESPLEKGMVTHSSIFAWMENSVEEELAGYIPWGHKRFLHSLVIKQ